MRARVQKVCVGMHGESQSRDFGIVISAELIVSERFEREEVRGEDLEYSI